MVVVIESAATLKRVIGQTGLAESARLMVLRFALAGFPTDSSLSEQKNNDPEEATLLIDGR